MSTQYYSLPVPVATDYVKDGWDAIADLGNAVDSAVAIPTYNNQTGTTYTFVLTDAAKVVSSNNGSAVTFTVPPQSSVTWTTGATLTVTNFGAGAVTFAGGSGVTVTNSATTLAQYQTAKIIRTGSDAWTVIIMAGSASPIVSIASGTFSNSTGINLSNVLSSTYKVYRLVTHMYGTSSTGIPIIKFRENTTDNSSGYWWGGAGGNFGGTSFFPGSGNSGSGSFQFSGYGASSIYQATLSFDIFRPDATTGVISGTGYGDWDNRAYTLSGTNRTMTNFTGLSIYGSTNITGSYYLYAYN